jgi:hypothetical protein
VYGYRPPSPDSCAHGSQCTSNCASKIEDRQEVEESTNISSSEMEDDDEKLDASYETEDEGTKDEGTKEEVSFKGR